MPDLVESTRLTQRQAEQLFAACVLVAPEIARQEAGWLAPEIITDERIRRFWGCVRDGEHPTKAMFPAGLQTDLLLWSTWVVSVLDVRQYANQIAVSDYLTKIGAALPEIAKKIAGSDVEGLRLALRELADASPGASDHAPTADEVADEYAKIINGPNRCVKTGIAKLDDNAGGLERQTLTVLAGVTSSGKSALALQIARNVAGPIGGKACYFSLEMSQSGLWGRITPPEVNLTHQDVISRRITEEQQAALLEKNTEMGAFYGEKLLIYDEKQTTESIWQRVADQRPDLVIVDHLRLLKDQHASEVKRQGLIVENLHDMGKDLDCVVLVLAQLSRAHQSNPNDKRPNLKDLRDSGEIEENSDNVFMIYRDDIFNPPIIRPRYLETELWLRKYRAGGRDGLVRLAFDEKNQWFEPWPPQEDTERVVNQYAR